MDWEPLRGDHSIESVAATVTFANVLEGGSIDALAFLGRRIAKPYGLTERAEFLEPVNLQGTPLVIQVDLEAGIPSKSSRRVVFRRKEESGAISQELSIGSSQIRLMSQKYTRWRAFYEMFVEIYTALLDEFSNDMDANALAIRAVRLQYRDRFSSAVGGGEHAQVIRMDSPYVTPSLRDQLAGMHVHSGWFTPEPDNLRRLFNVNIDIQDISHPPPPEPRRQISILTMEQIETLTPGASLEKPLEWLDVFHQDLKNVYRDIITEEAAKSVALDQ